MLLLNYLSKKAVLASLLMLPFGCFSMQASSAVSLFSQQNNSSWGSKLRNSLPTSFSSAWEKSRDSFNALPTGYRYAVGGGATTLLFAGGAFLYYKKFAVRKQTPLSTGAHVITALVNPDPVAAYIEQYSGVGHQKNFPTEGGFVQFQNKSDIGPTQMLQAVCKDNYVNIEETAHHWSVLVNSGANPFAPSTAANEVNAFVSLAKKFEPQFILPVVQYGRGIYRKYTTLELFTPDEIKAGIKATLVQLLAKNGFEAEFNNIVAIVGNDCKKPEIAFTASDWEDVLVSAGANIVNEEDRRLLEVFAFESSCAQAPACSLGFETWSDESDYEDQGVQSTTNIFNGVQCVVTPHYPTACSICNYTVVLTRDSSSSRSFVCSPETNLPAYIARKLRDDFGITSASEDGVKEFLIQSNVPGFVVNIDFKRKLQQRSDRRQAFMKTPGLPSCTLEFGVPAQIALPGRIMEISCRVTLRLGDRENVCVVIDNHFQPSMSADDQALFPYLKNVLRSDFDLELSDEQIDDYLAESGLREAINKAYGHTMPPEWGSWCMIALCKDQLALQDIPVICNESKKDNASENESAKNLMLYYSTLRQENPKI